MVDGFHEDPETITAFSLFFLIAYCTTWGPEFGPPAPIKIVHGDMYAILTLRGRDRGICGACWPVVSSGFHDRSISILFCTISPRCTGPAPQAQYNGDQVAMD